MLSSRLDSVIKVILLNLHETSAFEIFSNIELGSTSNLIKPKII